MMIMKCWFLLFSGYVLNSEKKDQFWFEFCLLETFEFVNVFLVNFRIFILQFRCLLFGIFTINACEIVL